MNLGLHGLNNEKHLQTICHTSKRVQDTHLVKTVYYKDILNHMLFKLQDRMTEVENMLNFKSFIEQLLLTITVLCATHCLYPTGDSKLLGKVVRLGDLKGTPT